MGGEGAAAGRGYSGPPLIMYYLDKSLSNANPLKAGPSQLLRALRCFAGSGSGEVLFRLICEVPSLLPR